MYSKLKESMKNTITEISYYDILENVLFTTFNYENIPDTLSIRFLEFYLNYLGKCAIWKYENELICSPVNFVGDIDVYGISKDAVCITRNGKQKTFKDWKNNNNVVIIFNNSNWSRDFTIERYSELFTECDKSLKTLIINSKYNKILKASTETEKNALETLLDQVNSGKPSVVVGDNTFSEIVEGSGAICYDFNDLQVADKIQYLSQLHSDLWKRFYNMNGYSTISSNKLAQQSVSEINESSNSALILPLDKLNARIKGIEKVNEIFDTNISVAFSELIKREIAQTDEEEGNDDTIEEVKDEMKEGESDEE